MDLTKTLPIMGKKKEVTLIAKDAEMVGDVSFSSQLIVNGVLKGSTTGVDPGAAITVSPTGRVIGDIRVPMVLIHGTVEGTVYATEALEVAEGAVIQGDLHYQVLQMHMGASVQGRLIHTVPIEVSGDSAGGQEVVASSAEEQTKSG